MPSIRQIAQDPHNALKDLEKELGVEPGALLADMDRLAGAGDAWKHHLPYLIAESYYEDEAARAQYQGHVDACEYCKTLLQTLHPSDPEVRNFAQQATAAFKLERKRDTRRTWPAYSVPLAMAASIAATAVAIPLLQRDGVLPSASRQQQLIVNELRLQPGTLAQLETSSSPTERYRAAQYYFAVEQPQLAYRQIGEGLELAGLGANDARKITTAADIPRDNSAAPTLALAAQRVETLKATAVNREPTQFLELAVAEAKLGLHDQSLKSIRKYLEAQKADPQLLAEFSETALARRPTASTAQ